MKSIILMLLLIIASYGVEQERIKEIMSKATGYTDGINTISFVKAKYSTLGGLYTPRTIWIYDQGESTDVLAYYLSHEYGHNYCWKKLRMYIWGEKGETCAEKAMEMFNGK